MELGWLAREKPVPVRPACRYRRAAPQLVATRHIAPVLVELALAVAMMAGPRLDTVEPYSVPASVWAQGLLENLAPEVLLPLRLQMHTLAPARTTE